MRLECWFRRRVETIFFLLAVGRVLSKREGRVCDRQDVGRERYHLLRWRLPARIAD